MRTVVWLAILVLVALAARHALNHPESWPRPESDTVTVTASAPLPSAAPLPTQMREPEPTSPTIGASPTVAAEVSQADFEINESAEAVAEACANPSATVVERQVKQVYRWTDERGHTQFGDRPPAGAKAKPVAAAGSASRERFVLNISYDENRAVPFLKDRLRANITGIHELIADLAGRSSVRDVAVNLRVFADRRTYAAYARMLSPTLNNTGGYYSPARNEAATFHYRDDAQTLAVARHESTHVMMAGMFGNTPPWLNEGLAEYFEGLEMTGQRAVVHGQPHWLRRAREALSSGYPQTLEQYLQLPHNRWYARRRDANYALAGTLVWFLMDSPAGRDALGDYLRELSSNYCSEVAPFNWINRHYAGGVREFERQFRRWLMTAPATVHRY